ncbi:serine hydrolase domain-containing protein [Ottowia thiooxydans]|uniref:serine hydrolase domain-containing protein n=1 Tax=Ottowia thiooxydans TaxID=219182 RepID=UPI00146C21BD|nr:serine hydrolase [Ottowia thiooxydans]
MKMVPGLGAQKVFGVAWFLPTWLRAFLLTLLVATASAALAQKSSSATAASHAEWPQLSPGKAAKALQLFGGLATRIESQYTDVRSVVVVQDGQLTFEYYRRGIAADTLQDTQSVTKSVLALLVGQALKSGQIKRVDQLVAELVPELARAHPDPRASQLRIAHLLTMTAGWPGAQFSQRDLDDNVAWITRRPFVASPGNQFNYDNGAANLLAIALSRAVGKPVSEFAREQLFTPLGIRHFSWAKGANGYDLGALGLRLGTRDMARLGELALGQGKWGSNTLVPSEFMRAATSTRNSGGPPLGTPYGYLWWVANSAPDRGATHKPFVASGHGGQWIWVYPELNLVVAATSNTSPQSMARGQAITLIRTQILQASRALVK